MKQKKRPASQTEAMKLRWKKRIVFEKGYTEMCAEWMAERLEALTDHLQYGHAAIAYQKQNGDFRLVKATLIYYEAEFHKKYDPTKIEGAVVYWNVDEQRWTTFQVENFMEENAMEVIEAKYGIKGSAIVLKLLCKIYKEGYFIRWDEEQCLIFANKAGREVQAAEVQGIIEILFIKGIMDKNSYLENGILTSENIQKVWMEATKRRKRELSELPYLMVKTEKENDKPEKESGKPDNASTQQEIEQPKPLKEGKAAVGTGDVAVSPGNVVHDVAVNAKNACNSGQSKVKKSRAKENKEFPPSAPPEGKEEERKEDSVSLPIPGYAFNTMTHNYPGLTDTLQRLGINEVGEVNAILRLSDYGRKGTTVWRLIANTCWSDIGAKGRYLIAALNRAKRK